LLCYKSFSALRRAFTAYRAVRWREGSAGILRSRFAAVRVRAAHGDYGRTTPHGE